MANNKTSTKTGKTTAGKKKTTKSSSSRGRKTATPPPPPKKNGSSSAPVRESNGGNALGGVIFLVLAICSAISYFNTEGSFVSFFSQWLRGLLGWGFYLAAPAFLISAVFLFTCGDRPVASRVFATVMLPVFLAAICFSTLRSGKASLLPTL